MVRFTLGLFIYSTCLCFTSSALAKSRVIRESNIIKYLKIVEDWDADEISHETLTMSEDKTKIVRAYKAQVSCGRGACVHHLFLDLKNKKWKYIGKIDGRFEVEKTVKRGLFILIANHSMPGLSQKTSLQRYKFNGKAFEKW